MLLLSLPPVPDMQYMLEIMVASIIMCHLLCFLASILKAGYVPISSIKMPCTQKAKVGSCEGKNIVVSITL